MDIRQAILRTADDIDRDGRVYNFYQGNVGECGTPCCALARIGLHAGVKRGGWWYEVCEDLFGMCTIDWYRKVAETVGGGLFGAMKPELVATALRLYADKYHPAPVKVPDWEAIATKPPSPAFALG